MERFRKGQKGFTLIEILIVAALIEVLAAIVLPNVQGFLGRGKEDSWKGDKKTIQVAVDGYYTKNNAWPTFNAGTGLPSFVANTYIDPSLLVNGQFLNDTPASANTFNGGTGTYGWYVDDKGRVQSLPTFTPGTYP